MHRAFLIDPALKAVALENAFIEVYLNRRGIRQMRGRGFIRNILIVQLLEETDEIDLIMDLGDEFKYLLKNPSFEAGKVFSPHIKSTLQFSPNDPWTQISQKEFENLVSRLDLITV